MKKGHYKNDLFLKSLGKHCQKLRVQKGYSIDRMSKEGENLSPSVIHRLELGNGAVTVSAIYRIAKVLGVHPKELLDFSVSFEEFGMKGETSEKKKIKVWPKIWNDKEVLGKKQAYKSFLPLYSLKAAAGYFGNGQDVKKEGWVKIPAMKLDSSMFVVRAVGHSMSPKISDGDYLVFRANPEGTRQGKIVLVQYHGPADPETGGAYTVKLYSSAKIHGRDGSWRHQQITLSPLNPEYEPIVLQADREGDFKVIGEYLFTI